MKIFKRVLWVCSFAFVIPTTLMFSCSVNNQISSQKYEPTKINSVIFYQELNLDKDIQKAQKQINKVFLIQNKNLIFGGTTKYLNSVNQILEVEVNQKQLEHQQSLVIKIKLELGSYIDNEGMIAKSSQIFQTVINGFSNQSGSYPDFSNFEIIQEYLKQISQNATFDVNNKNQKPSEVLIDEIIWKQANDNFDLGFFVNQTLPDDINGKLGLSGVFYFESIFYEFVIYPSDIKAILGFKKANDFNPPTINPQEIIDNEIARLNNLQKPIISKKLWNLDELIQLKENPNELLNYLNDLKTDQFQYDIFNLNIELIENQKNSQQVKLKFVIKIIYSSLIKNTNEFEELINVDTSSIPPNTDHQNTAIIREKNRLNSIQLVFKKTSWTKLELEAIKNNPKQIFQYLFGWVPMQYFKYEIIELNSGIFKNSQIQLVFKIKAIYTKNISNQESAVSPLFKFNLSLLETDEVEDLPPIPDMGDYEFLPKVKDIENDVLTVDIQNDSRVNLASIKTGDDVKKLFVNLLTKSLDTFFDFKGNLPSKWDWNKQIMIGDYVDPKPGDSEFETLVYIFNYTSNPQDEDDDQIYQKIKLINVVNDSSLLPSKPQPPSEQEQFNAFKKEFELLIKDQKIDDWKLHLGNAGVFQFANLTTDQFGSSFINFLNFSLTALEAKFNHKFLIKAIDAKINYLKNSIKWKWQISKNDQQILWTSNEQYLEYFPSEPFIDVLDKEKHTDSRLDLAPNSMSMKGLLDKFQFNPDFVSKQNQQDKLTYLGKHWEWKARELVTYARFVFYQTFNNKADQINYGIENINLNDSDPSGYDVVLKARINQDVSFVPFIQIFDITNKQIINLKKGQIITIRLNNVRNILSIPTVYTSASEILPGLSMGTTWGTGLGLKQTLDNRDFRTDTYSVHIGTYDQQIFIDDQVISFASATINHRFLNLLLMNRYEFKDPI